MNRCSSLLLPALVVCLTGFFSACSNNNRQVGIEGTGDTMTSRGVVTKLGSIYVNGIHFKTDQAEIYVDGELTTEDAILQGMVVTVEATAGDSESEAIAHKVNFSYLVTGPVEGITLDANNSLNLTMPGYTVIVPENTVFKGTAYDTLKIGDVVSVSGLQQDDSTIYASQITSVSEAPYTTLQGKISNLDTTSETFSINGITVEYNAAEHKLPITKLNDGAFISVRGDLYPQYGLITANSIYYIGEPDFKNTRSVTEEGFVSYFESSESFRLNGIKVTAKNATFTGGNPSELRDRVRISVKGSYQDKVLVASNVHMILPTTFRTSGTVNQVDPKRRVITIADMEFKIDSFTGFLDNQAYSNRYFDLHDLRVGDQIDVYAHRTPGGWTAISVRRTPNTDEPFSIKGPITAIDKNGNLYLDNLLVLLNDIPKEKRWPFQIGHSIFVLGTMVDSQVLAARDIFPAIYGCTRWISDECRPPPPPSPGFPPQKDDAFDWPTPFEFKQLENKPRKHKKGK